MTMTRGITANWCCVQYDTIFITAVTAGRLMGLIRSVVLVTSTAHPLLIKISLLYGLLNWGEAHLIYNWLL